MITVIGSVLDNDFGIIPFANVTVVGENRSTSAGADGKFYIVANGSNSILRFSHAAFDYDEISVSEFLKNGYINLFPPSLDEAEVINNYKKPDNTLLWVFGITAIAAIGYAVTKKTVQPVKVKA